MWICRILTVLMATTVFNEAVKVFKPKFPEIPVLNCYKGRLPDEFWDKFPVNLKCPAVPSLKKKKLKQWAQALGVSDPERLQQVLGYVENGADIGCKGAAPLPSRSSNAPSAYDYGPQVTDAIAEWVKKGYAYGPVGPDRVPEHAKVSGIMVWPKPNGSV
jgi:hypothetical protein